MSINKRFVEELRSSDNDGVDMVSPRTRAALKEGAVKLLPRTAALVSNAVTYDLRRLNPYQVESLLDRSFRELEACLALRRQYFDYQAQADTARLDYELFQALYEIEGKQLELQDTPVQHEGLMQQSSLRHDGKDNEIVGTAGSVARAKQFASDSKALLEQRRVAARSREDALERHREDKFHGLNLPERSKRVWKRYSALLLECSCLSLAIADGMKLVYGAVSEPLPQLDAPDYLDVLVAWNRDVLMKLERILRRDVEYDLHLSLRRAKNGDEFIVPAWRKPGTGRNINRGTTTARLGVTDLEFSLDMDSWFPDQEYVRLRGFWVVVKTDPDVKKDGRWRVTVAPPQPRIGDGAHSESLGLPTLRFGAVGERHDRAGVRRMRGTEYFNVDPCSGTWKLNIGHLSSGGTECSRIDDIEVVLRVATLSAT